MKHEPLDVALVSCVTLPEPDPDEQPLLDALAAAGLKAQVLAWDDPGVDWSRAQVAVLRSSWNYPWMVDEFLNWATTTSAVTDLWNPLELVRWNLHKRYLVELERHGVPVTPTVVVERGAKHSLASVLDGRDWAEAVVKPAVSAGSFRTMKVDRASRDAGESHFRSLVAERDALIQPYLNSVEEYGERALVWIDGELTHSVRKQPRFAGQDESVSEAMPITDAERRLARLAVEVIDGTPLYARIDAAPGPDGNPIVMELEMIEPSLFFPQCPAALDRFVTGIRDRLVSG